MDALLHALQSAVGKKDMDNKVGQPLTRQLKHTLVHANGNCTVYNFSVYFSPLVCGELCLYYEEPVLPRPQRGAWSRKVPGPLSATGPWLSRTTEEEKG